MSRIRRGLPLLAQRARGLCRPPADSRTSRLSRKSLHEVTIYLGDDNTLFVHHLCLTGQGQAEVGIRMCWEAMQFLAMRSGLALNLPTQAALPVQVTPLPPEAAAVSAHTDNGSP